MSKNRKKQPPNNRLHGPQNADHEIRKAYNNLIQAELVQQYELNKRKLASINNLNPNIQDLINIYKHAFRKYRDGQLLSAERWAHTAKHLAKALFLEATIEFLERRTTDLPYLAGATPDDYDLIHEKSDTVEDLLNSVAGHIPQGFDKFPDFMERCLKRAREHLKRLNNSDYHHELLRADRIKAAYHYGRVVEVMALAYGADFEHKVA